VLIPVLKPNGSIRPVAMGEILYKTAALYAISLIKDELPKLFPRIQLGVSVSGGSERAAHLISHLREAMSSSARRDVIVLAIDFANAFNAASRTQILRVLLGNERCKPLWRIFQWAYGGESPLYVYERDGSVHTTLQSRRGVRQGDPLAALAFALTVQPLYEAALHDLPSVRGIAIQDDLSVVGPAEEVMQVFDRIMKLSPDYCLDLQVPKCKVLLPADASQREAVAAMAAERNLPTTDKLLTVLGTRIARCSDDDALIEAECLSEAEQHQLMFERLAHPEMQADPQVALLLLRACALPRMHYVARTTRPSLLRSAAERFDGDALRCFGRLVGIDTAQLDAARLRQITLPLSEGGFGIRPLSRVSTAAYLAAGMLALSDLIDALPSDDAQARWPDHPLCRSLQQCFNTLAAEPNGVQLDSVIRHGLLDGPAEHWASGLWTRLKAALCSAEKDDCLEHIQSGIQKAVTLELEIRLLETLKDPSTTSVRDRIRLVALSAPHAARAMSVLPTEECFRMSSSQVRSLCRRRLGLVPKEQLVHHRCPCTAARTDLPFKRDSTHIDVCKKLKYGTVLRHNAVLYAAAQFSGMCGFTHVVEPASLAKRMRRHAATSRTGTARPVHGGDADELDDDDDDSDDSEIMLADSGQQRHLIARRADLLVAGASYFGYADVSITHPAQAALRTKSSNPPAAVVPLHAAKRCERFKTELYKKCPAFADYKVTPVVLESYGGIGVKAVEFVRLLAARTDRPKQMEDRGLDMLAVALVQGNTLMEDYAVPALLRAAHADGAIIRRHDPIPERISDDAAAGGPSARRRLSFNALCVGA